MPHIMYFPTSFAPFAPSLLGLPKNEIPMTLTKQAAAKAPVNASMDAKRGTKMCMIFISILLFKSRD